MRKVIVGLVVVLIVGVGGYLGVVHWAQYAAAREVDAVLDGWRSSVGSATRGPVEFDLWTRTLKISDVVVQSRTAPHPRMTVAQVVASGIDASGKAARVDMVDWEMTDASPGQSGVRVHQKAPRVTLTGFSARPAAPRKIASALDTLRLRLEQFSAITAASIDVPSLAVTVTPAQAEIAPGAGGAAEYIYSNVALRDVRNGRVAAATADRVVLRTGIGSPFGEIRGEIAKPSIADADLVPVLAFLDPSRPRSQSEGEGYQRIYRQMSMGPYTLRFGDGSSMRMERLVADNIGLQPAKLSLDDILFLTEVAPPTSGAPSATQMSMVIDKVAGLYEGVRIGRLEMRGLTVVSKRDTVKIASLQLNGLENGRLAEFALEGLDGGPAIGEPVKIGRITLIGLDISNLLRATTELSVANQPARLERLVRMLALLGGIELKDVAVPHRRTGRMIRLEALDASWGQFVGGVPTQARLSLKLAGPIGAMDPTPLNMLASRGVTTLSTSVDIGASWVEKEQALTLAPATVEVGNLLSLSLKASVGNVRREFVSADPVTAFGGAALAEVGPFEVSLRDLGIVDLVAAEMARAQGATPEEGRALLLEALTRNAEALAQANPEAQPFLQAVAELVQGKAGTLTVKLTPKGHVRVLELAEAMKLDPAGALLAGFNVVATTAR